MNYKDYVIKIDVIKRVREEEQKIETAELLSVGYIAWFLGMSKGKTLLQHYRYLLGEVDNKKIGKKGILWKVKQIVKQDKKDKDSG